MVVKGEGATLSKAVRAPAHVFEHSLWHAQFRSPLKAEDPDPAHLIRSKSMSVRAFEPDASALEACETIPLNAENQP